MSKFDDALAAVYKSLVSEADTPQTALGRIEDPAGQWDSKTLPQKAVALATGSRQLKKSSGIKRQADRFYKGPGLKKMNKAAQSELDNLKDAQKGDLFGTK